MDFPPLIFDENLSGRKLVGGHVFGLVRYFSVIWEILSKFFVGFR